MGQQYYIAYGSNLNMYQMKRRCPRARVVGKSVVIDYALRFKGCRRGVYLTIEEESGSEVPVAVWAVEPDDVIALDHYEGFPILYYKTQMNLMVTESETGKTDWQQGFVYIMHEDKELGIPSDDYLAECMEGYDDFGFDKSVLLRAVEASNISTS